MPNTKRERTVARGNELANALLLREHRESLRLVRRELRRRVPAYLWTQFVELEREVKRWDDD